MSALRLAPARVELERRGGNIYLRSPQKLAPFARCVTEWLVRWSDEAPERTFLAERKGDGWRKLSYREAYGAVRRISQALLDLGLSAERHAGGRGQELRHAFGEPAAAPGGVAVRGGPASRRRRLAALEPHLRRQSRFRPGAAEWWHAVRRWRQAASWIGGDDGEEPGGA